MLCGTAPHDRTLEKMGKERNKSTIWGHGSSLKETRGNFAEVRKKRRETKKFGLKSPEQILLTSNSTVIFSNYMLRDSRLSQWNEEWGIRDSVRDSAERSALLLLKKGILFHGLISGISKFRFIIASGSYSGVGECPQMKWCCVLSKLYYTFCSMWRHWSEEINTWIPKN